MRKLILIFLLVFLAVVFIYYLYPERALPGDAIIDSLIVKKSERVLLAYSGKVVIKKYNISLGKNPIGNKKVEGDGRTPEGKYFINGKNDNSAFYKNLGISYPDAYHNYQAKKLNKSAGGYIKIHGLKNGLGFIGKFQRYWDWTDGCIALTDREIDELYEYVKIGTPIIIYK